MSVLHHCDNPSCVNPEHLFLGTATDNMRDMTRKGRNIRQTHPEKFRGENAGLAKLTEEQVRDIRRLYAAGGVTYKELARRYGVAKYAIQSVVKRLTWREVE